MTKPDTKTEATPQNAGVSASSPPGKATAMRREEGLRDTVEAIAIAFILAFVFKTYEAEAFVIPTGSMAPTLFGRHKEVVCDCCQLPYPVGASGEINQETGLLIGRIRNSACPNCRFVNNILDAPVFNGDRIVVNKQVTSWNRYDVVVFRNPEEPHVNYIKRLIGLPGETVSLRQGDVYTRNSADAEWQIQRKQDPTRQLAIQIPVYDDRYPPQKLLQAGAEERWVPAVANPQQVDLGGWPAMDNEWKADRQERSFAIEATTSQLNWLRYRHLVPSPTQLQAAASDLPIPSPLQPELITDFCGFNAERDNLSNQGRFWTSDLTLRFQLTVSDVRDADSVVLLELVEGQRTVHCELKPSDGSVRFHVASLDENGTLGERQLLAEASSDFRAGDEYEICFANVDDRLLLWIDGDLIETGETAVFETETLNLPTDADLAPAGIAVAAGLNAEVSQLQLLRDIYYRNDLIVMSDPQQVMAKPGTTEFRNEYFNSQVEEHTSPDFRNRQALSSCLRSPEAYAIRYSEIREDLVAEYGDDLYFALDDDEYLMLGDNSPASKDSRLFDNYSRPMRGISSSRYAVRDFDLIGKAMFIFWPHGVPFLNGGKGFGIMGHSGQGRALDAKKYPLYRLPFYPNFSRMKVIY
jgi:signal peptidase I